MGVRSHRRLWQQVATTGAVPIKRCLTRCLWQPASASMLMFGGQTDDNPFLGDLWVLDAAKGTWARASRAAAGRAKSLRGKPGRRRQVVHRRRQHGRRPYSTKRGHTMSVAAWSLVTHLADRRPRDTAAMPLTRQTRCTSSGGTTGRPRSTICGCSRPRSGAPPSRHRHNRRWFRGIGR